MPVYECVGGCVCTCARVVCVCRVCRRRVAMSRTQFSAANWYCALIAYVDIVNLSDVLMIVVMNVLLIVLMIVRMLCWWLS